MAETKKKEKYKGGPSRKSYLRSMAGETERPMGEYSKFGDIDPSLVHEGDATYRDITVSDTSVLNRYSTNVFRGHGKSYFIYKGQNPSGTLYQSVNGALPTPV